METGKQIQFWGFFIVLVLFTACSINKYSTKEKYRINDFPTPPHTNKVEIILPGDEPRDKEYIRTHYFEAYSSYWETLSDMLKRIEIQGESAHVDAIIMQDPVIYYETKLLSGLGIKYKSNVDYLSNHRLVDQLYLFNLETQEFEQIANLYPDFNNQIFKVEGVENYELTDYYFENFIEKFSIPFLVDDKRPQWSFKVNTIGQLYKRKYFRANPKKRIDVTMNYKDNFIIDKLKVRYLNAFGIRTTYNIHLDYDTKGRILQKRISDNSNHPFLNEVFTYDEDGKLLNSVYYKINSGTETPFLKTNYFYFRNEDVYEYF